VTEADQTHCVLLDERSAAKFLNISVRSLQRYRVDGGGPTFIKIGAKRICYLVRDLTSYIEARRFASTSAAEQGHIAAQG
jgi:hypothetical protein